MGTTRTIGTFWRPRKMSMCLCTTVDPTTRGTATVVPWCTRRSRNSIPNISTSSTPLCVPGLRFNQFELTDNSCRAAESKLEEFEADLVFVETRVASGVQTGAKRVALGGEGRRGRREGTREGRRGRREGN